MGDPNFFTLGEVMWHLKWCIQHNPSDELNNYLAWAKTIERDAMERIFQALQHKNILGRIEYNGERPEWGHAEWMFVNPVFDYANTYTMPRF